MTISYNTKGANNAYGYLANSIRFNKERQEKASDNLPIDRNSGGIIVLPIGKRIDFNLIDFPKWTIGKYCSITKYLDNQPTFDKTSMCIEILDVDKEVLIEFSKKISSLLNNKSVMVNPYGHPNILFVDNK